jgi:hypothetical protein
MKFDATHKNSKAETKVAINVKIRSKRSESDRLTVVVTRLRTGRKEVRGSIMAGQKFLCVLVPRPTAVPDQFPVQTAPGVLTQG